MFEKIEDAGYAVQDAWERPGVRAAVGGVAALAIAGTLYAHDRDILPWQQAVAEAPAPAVSELAALATDDISKTPADASPSPDAASPAIIDMAKLPPTLPEAVKAILPNVAKIEAAMTKEDGTRGTGIGSGLLINGNTILTAQHVVANEAATRQSADCGSVDVYASTSEPRPDPAMAHNLAYTLKGLTRAADEVKALPYNDRDIALVTLKPENDTREQPDPVKPVVFRDIVAEPLQRNESLFMLAFGPNAPVEENDPIDRNPDQRTYLEEDALGVADPKLKMLPNQDEAHVIGAVLFDVNQPDGKEIRPGVDALTNLKDYSEYPDPKKSNRTGDSGGVGVDAHGRVIGIISEGIEQKYTKLPLRETLKHYVETGEIPKVKNEPENYKPDLTTLAPVGAADIAMLQQLPPLSCVPNR